MERKKRPVKGKTTKAMLFTIDNDLLEHLYSIPNKSRYINNLVRCDMVAGGVSVPVADEAKTLVAVKPQKIDGDATTAVFLKAKDDYPDCVILFEHGESYDALFEDARTVKRMIRNAVVGTAETSRGAKNLSGCMITTIPKADAAILQGMGVGVVMCKYVYQCLKEVE